MAGTGNDGLPREHLVFSHANGFPAPAYRKLLHRLQERFEVSHVTRFGHDGDYPVARGWGGLRRQLLDHLASLPADARPWLVGHSLGGYLSVLAGAELGTSISGIVLLDSPLIGGLPRQVIRWGRRAGWNRFLMPLRQTRQRRREWPDLDAVVAHFLAKPKFTTWDRQVLRDYAEHATVAQPDGRRILLFDRDVEHRIYSTLPTGSVVQAAGSVQAPSAFIAGTGSREIRYLGIAPTRRLVGERLHWIEGSHLFPMERPLETADAIMAAIRGMRGDGRGAR